MKLLVLFLTTLSGSVLSLSADGKVKDERVKIEVHIAHSQQATISRVGGDKSRDIKLEELLDISKLIPNKHGLEANLYFPKGSDQESTDFKMMFMFLKASLEKQNCHLYEAKISSCGSTGIYVYGPNKAAFEARQKLLREQFEKKMDSTEIGLTEFTKDITFMKLLDKKLRENKKQKFTWNIDKERSLTMFRQDEENLPDIEPMLIRILGPDKFTVNRVEALNLDGIKSRLYEYASMAKSAGGEAIIEIHTGELSAAEVYPILMKLHKAGLKTLYFKQKEIEEIIVKPPVKRRPPSPHRR